MTASPAPRSVESGSADAPAIAAWLTACIADYREVAPAEIDPRASFTDLGLDSVYALTLCGDIEDHWGLETDPTVAWDYPTIESLAEYLSEQLRTERAG